MIEQYRNCSNFKQFMNIRRRVRPDIPVCSIYSKNPEEPPRDIMADEFIRDINSLGTWLFFNGYRGRHIAILGENSYEWIITLFAAVNGSNAAVILDTTKTADELCEVVRDCDVEVIVYSQSFAKTALNIKMHTGLPLIPMDSLSEKAEEGRKLLFQGFRDFVDHDTDSDAVAVICCTSGTSGRSKGVMISQKSIVRIAVKAFEIVYYPDFGKTMLLLPLYHIYSLVHNVFMAIAMGGTLCITGGIRYFVDDYLRIRPEMLILVPRLVEVLSSVLKKNPDVKASSYILCGGAAPELTLMREFADRGITIVVGYGLTESAACAAVSVEFLKYPDGSMQFLNGIEYRLEDADENGVGELLISGDGIMLGYYKMPYETEKAIDKEGFLHTGDLACITEEGRVIIKGRKDRMMILPSGVNVPPEEIEADIAAIDGVTEVLVRLDDDMITAFIYTEEPEKRESIQEAINEINRNCSTYRETEKVVFLDDPLPKTGAGKIKYN